MADQVDLNETSCCQGCIKIGIMANQVDQNGTSCCQGCIKIGIVADQVDLNGTNCCQVCVKIGMRVDQVDQTAEGTSNARILNYVIRSHYVTMVDNKPQQVSHCCKTCIHFCGVRVLY
jgi:hypothetical protein